MSGDRRRSIEFIRPAVFGLLLALAPNAMSDLFPKLFSGGDEDAEIIFEGGDQHVKLVNADSDGAKRQNEHPVELTSEDLETVLAELKFEKSGGLFGGEVTTIPLFLRNEIALLAAKLPEAFAKAQPEQDVVFTVEGRHRGRLAKERMAVAGRMFYLDGKLNLILGDVHKPFQAYGRAKDTAMAAGCADCVDSMPLPKERFSPGRRERDAKLDFAFASLQGVDAMRDDKGRRRTDWLIIDVPRVAATIEQQRREAAVPEAVRREAKELSLERRRMREEMARMRKEMEGLAKGGGKSLEERLATLDELKARGLVTEEEYQAKRQEILNEI